MPTSFSPHPSSFRDPSGFMFGKDGMLYRQVNISFKAHFDKFRSELYPVLVGKEWIIPHEEINENLSGLPGWLTTLKPEKLPFISYPYEWSFSMLKDAALLTLNIAKEAMLKGMMLKDATPFNVQFRKGRPVFIDSLSFEIYDETKPWIAYRQFCECFLSPLLLAHHLQQPVHALLLAYPEGIPLEFTAAALPKRTRFSLHTYLHIHLHAKTKQGVSKKQNSTFSEKKLRDILASLELAVNKCRPPARSTAWSGYYEEASGREDYLVRKIELVKAWCSPLGFDSLLDLGGNTGRFTELLQGSTRYSVVTDADAICIDELYRDLVNKNDPTIQPLVIDLAWPSPALGLRNRERDSFIERVRGTQMVMALALVHHLAVGKNIPLEQVAAFLSEMTGRYLLMEFIPKEDEKVQQMLVNRADVFDRYSIENFESAFASSFVIHRKEVLGSSGRTLYLFEKK